MMKTLRDTTEGVRVWMNHRTMSMTDFGVNVSLNKVNAYKYCHLKMPI